MKTSAPLAALVTLVLTLAVMAPALRAAGLPATLSIVGETQLQLTGQGTREKLFIDLYTVGLYLPRPLSEVEPIRQHDISKAFRVEVVYDGSIPNEVPENWWEELVPVLSAQQEEQLKEFYFQLQPQDTILISYAPGQGTQIKINGETKIIDKGHALMSAYIDIWLGGNPVSEELRNSLL
ncbi:MAG: chalcone isomerase family protein [Candidatus Competibacteraceae bacterium]|nr:chalcone isomerase family protein [Candidatus Competibacteraceae bacterium]